MTTGSDRMRIVSQEAAYWLLRWSDDAGKMPREDQREFVLWLKQSPENIREFLRILHLDSKFSRQKLRDQITKVDSNVVHGDFGNGINLYDYQPCDSVSDKVPRKRKPATIGTWVARAAMVLMAVSLVFTFANRSPEGVVETAAGQWQHMNVEDGSNIHMDARTSLKKDMKPERRIIHLYAGQAVFDVASDRNRPFTVRTKLVDVTAVGTRFAVKIDQSGGVTTIVEEGVVEVTPRDGQDGVAVRLHPGEELHVPKTDTLQLSEREKKEVDAKRKLQWTSGWYDVHGNTVHELVEEFNRRHLVQARIKDPKLAAQAVNVGRIKVDSVESFEAVLKSQEIEVIKEGGVITLTQRPRPE